MPQFTMKNIYTVNSSVKDLKRTHKNAEKCSVLSVAPTDVY